MKKGHFLLALLTSLLTILTSFASVPEGIQLTKTTGGYLIDFNLPQYQMTSTTIEGMDYLNILVPDYGIISEAGLPALPLVSFNIFISNEEEQPEFNIIDSYIDEVILSDKIFPFQLPWEKSKPLSDRPFTINKDYYNSTGNVNQPVVSISEPFIVGGVKGSMVTIYPFKYNPLENKLKIVNSLSFKIILNNPVLPVKDKSETFNSFLENVFVNYAGIDANGSMKYLIITAPSFESNMTQFVNYKNSSGFAVDIFNTNITGTSNSSIKDFIQQRYNNNETKPEFILLVGDVNEIPAWTGSGEGTPTTDLNYVLLEGTDYFADAFIGRFSVSSSDELQNAIDKTLYMDTYIGTLEKKNIFMASTDNWQISEGTHNYVIDNYFDPAGYTNRKLYTHTHNATTQQLIDALNENQIFAVYSGHGSTTGWADGPPLNQQQVRDLTNTWYPFVYSFACVTGSYHLGECFGETWLRTENGASTFYGSSVNSYWDEDDILERKIFYSMFEDNITRVTPMFVQGQIYLVNYYGGITGTTLRYLEMYNLMGDPSMPVVQQIPPDTTPPEAVNDLTTVNPTSNSITLNWTAPFDSTFGGVTAYDIRYSTAMINNDNDFNNAPQKLFSGQSDSAGTFKTFTVDELDFNTTYYFAIKAMDIWGNPSEMSNVPLLETFIAPEIVLNCDSMHCVVLPNSTFTDSIIVSNNTVQNSTLDYVITLTNNTFPDNVLLRLEGLNETVRTLHPGSKTNPVKANGYSFKGNGGPDLFGYKWNDSNEPNGPEYIWNDITVNPDAIQITNWQGNLDDGYTGAIPIGFEFEFYGVPFTELYINTNGFVSFNAISSSYYSNDPIPTTDSPNNIICPIWDDLDGRSQGTVYYLPEADKFTIQFTDWQHYSGTGSYTFQIVIKPNNRIYFYYNNLVGDLTSATVGIENNNGTDGLQVAYNSSYLANELAVQFVAEPEWLELDHYTGTLYNGTSAAIILDINTDDLDLGDYSMDLVITSNDPGNPEITIPVTMTVTNVVPVEFSSFTAVNSLENVLLKWETATETNNMGFEIERSQKSESSSQLNWMNIAFIDGNGTTTELTNYSYKDKIEKPGSYVYRLKQIDYDGTANYSSEIEVNVTGPTEFALYQNYPNPFNPSTTIKFALPEKAELVIVIYNSLGEKVAEVFAGELEEGYHQVDFNASSFPSGVYFYRFESKQFTAVKKMILIK